MSQALSGTNCPDTVLLFEFRIDILLYESSLCKFLEVFAKFSEVFRKVSESFRKVFGSFREFFYRLCRFSDVFGPIWIHSDLLGRIRMHLEASGRFWKHSDFGIVELVFDGFGHIFTKNFRPSTIRSVIASTEPKAQHDPQLA